MNASPPNTKKNLKMNYAISNNKKPLLVIGEDKRDSMMTDYDERRSNQRKGSIMINASPMTLNRDLKTDLRMTQPINLN